MILAIWNEFARFVADAAPAFAVGLTLSAGVQWLVARSHWAATAFSWVVLFEVPLWRAQPCQGAQ